MKSNYLTIAILSILSLFQVKAQKSFEPTPKGMCFIPQGSYVLPLDSISRTISLDAFWISNEITNQEYRKFTDFIRSHPSDSLVWYDFSKKNSPMRKGCTMGQISGGLIDSLALSGCYPKNSASYLKYKNYFTDKTFDNYPVVGVSQRAARYYCIWRTLTENRMLKDKGKPYIQEYRLPLEEEWYYVASKCKKTAAAGSEEVQPVNGGPANEFKVFQLFGNVSEWTSTSVEQQKVIAGASWKNKDLRSTRDLADPETSAGDIGFRVVRTYLGNVK